MFGVQGRWPSGKQGWRFRCVCRVRIEPSDNCLLSIYSVSGTGLIVRDMEWAPHGACPWERQVVHKFRLWSVPWGDGERAGGEKRRLCVCVSCHLEWFLWGCGVWARIDLYQFILSVSINHTYNNTSNTCETLLEWEESALRGRNKNLAWTSVQNMAHF